MNHKDFHEKQMALAADRQPDSHVIPKENYKDPKGIT